MVRTAGFEPACPEGLQILSLLRLPVSPRPRRPLSAIGPAGASALPGQPRLKLVTGGGRDLHGRKVARREGLRAGLDPDHVAEFDDSVVAGKFLQEKLREGDVALIKGSQGSRMEKIVKEIMADPLQAANLLVRQEEYWLKK